MDFTFTKYQVTVTKNTLQHSIDQLTDIVKPNCDVKAVLFALKLSKEFYTELYKMDDKK